MAKLTTATVATVAALGLTLGATPPAAQADTPSARPGTAIQQKTDNTVTTCTIALVGKHNNKRIAITAGHCKATDGPVTLTDGTPIGTFTTAKPENRDTLTTDASGYGIITLNDNIPTSAATKYGNLTGYRTAKTGDEVCILGATSGRACGKVTDTTATTLAMTTPVQAGDSGGPVIQYLDGPKDSSGAYVNFAIVGITAGKHDTTAIANPIDNAFAGIATTLQGWTITEVKT